MGLRGQRRFWCPAVLDAARQSAHGDTRASAPFGPTMRFAVELQHATVPATRRAAIVALLFLRGPSAVLWGVGAIVINAVKLMTDRTRPHVGKEGGEVVTPSLTHGNPAPSPVGVSRMVRVITARLRVAPRIVFWRRACARLVAVLVRSRYHNVFRQTPATPCRAGLQMARGGLCACAAVAAALPVAVSVLVSNKPQNFQASKAFPSLDSWMFHV